MVLVQMVDVVHGQVGNVMGMSCSSCGRELRRVQVAHVCIIFKICHEIYGMLLEICMLCIVIFVWR